MKNVFLGAAVLVLGGLFLTGCDDKKDKKEENTAVPAAPATTPPIAIPVTH